MSSAAACISLSSCLQFVSIVVAKNVDPGMLLPLCLTAAMLLLLGCTLYIVAPFHSIKLGSAQANFFHTSFQKGLVHMNQHPAADKGCVCVNTELD